RIPRSILTKCSRTVQLVRTRSSKPMTLSINDYLLLIVSAIAGISDLKGGKIFNRLTYPAIASGFLLSAAGGEVSPTDAAAGFAVGFIPLFFVNRMGGIGGGDVKLMGALGALAGYPAILHIM